MLISFLDHRFCTYSLLIFSADSRRLDKSSSSSNFLSFALNRA